MKKTALVLIIMLLFTIHSVGQEVIWSDWDTDQFDMGHRVGHAMAYDSARNVVVLFGGRTTDYTPTFYGDTWEWDCATRKWRKMNSHNSPQARAHHAMVYNPLRKSVMLQGGRQAYDGPDDTKLSPSTWEYKNGNWSLLSTVGPAKREKHKMVWDSARNQVVLFGGFRYPNALDETWIWENNGWDLRNPATVPRERFGHSMSFDSARGKVVMHSGSHDYDEHTVSQSTFEWDGVNWKMVATGGPGYKVYADMVYDANRGVSVLFGGSYITDAYSDTLTSYNETWEWNGVAWTKRVFQGFQPGKRYMHAMAYDSKNEEVLLWDGRSPQTFDYYMLFLGEEEETEVADLTILKTVRKPKQEIEKGEKLKLVTTVKNIGNKQAGKFRIQYYLSLDSELDDLDILVFQKLIHVKLNPGKRVRYTKKRKIKSSVEADDYWVIARIVPLEDDAAASNNVKFQSDRLSIVE